MLIREDTYYLDNYGLREFLERINVSVLSKQIRKVYEEDLTDFICNTKEVYNKDDIKMFMNDIEIYQIPNTIGLRMKDFLSSLITLIPNYLVNFELNTFTIYVIDN